MQPNIYGYVPSLAAAAAASALFAIVTTIHVVYVFRYRIWYFLPIIIGGMLEVGGFAARIISRNEPGALGPYAVQDLFLLLPPILYTFLWRICCGNNGCRPSIEGFEI